MDIVLGVSMTSSTVRMVLVEGDKADGVTVDHDVFDVSSIEDGATTPADQVIAAILGTQESAIAGGHSLKTVGVTWTDHNEAARLRDALVIRGLEDVFLVSELHAAGALAQAVGRAVSYDKTAVLLVNRDTATMSVVETATGSIVKVDTQSLHSADAMAVFAAMAADVASVASPPNGIFILGSGVDVAAVKTHIENLVSLPVHAPDEPDMALARGAALAAAQAPRYEASTTGLAYSQDPEDAPGEPGPGTVSALAFSDAATQMSMASDEFFDIDLAASSRPAAVSKQDDRKPFLLAGSALGSIFVVGVVALVISLAVNIRPTVDERPEPGQNAIVPTSQAPAPTVAQEAAPRIDVPEPAPETIQAPMPVASPRTVYAQAAPTVAAAAPAPAAIAPAPAAQAPVDLAPQVASVPEVGAPPLWLPSPNLLPTNLFENPFNIFRPQAPRWNPQVPTYNPQIPTWNPPTPTWRPPTPTFNPPTPTWRPPTPTWNPPTPTWRPPTPTWRPPTATWNPPTPTWRPPTPTYNPPTQQPQAPIFTRPPTQPSWIPTQQPQQPVIVPTVPVQQPQAPVVVPTVPPVQQPQQSSQNPFQNPFQRPQQQAPQQQAPQQQAPQQQSPQQQTPWTLFPDWDH